MAALATPGKVGGKELWEASFAWLQERLVSGDFDKMKALWDKHQDDLDVNYISGRSDTRADVYCGCAALHCCARNYHEAPDMIRFLVETCGADIDIRDQYGNTPLMIAAKAGRLDSVQELLALGANATLYNNSFQSAASIANQFNWMKIYDLLNELEQPMVKSASKT